VPWVCSRCCEAIQPLRAVNCNEFSISTDVTCYRRRFSHRASLVSFKRFEGDTVWCPIETAAYDLEWPVGDLETQLFGSDRMSDG